MKKTAFVLWFKEIESEDIALIGQKGVGLAEMVEAGLSIPNGFCVTSFAYSQYLKNARKMPEEMAQAIMKNYLRLGGFFKEALVAVRSSPLDKRLKAASFLNIKGEANVVEAVKKCWASEKTAVLVQRMVQSRVSGVAFSTNPENKKEIVIRAIYGLGELAVEGKVVPDEYTVNKNTLKILKKEINPQLIKVPKPKQNLQKLTDQEIINLAKLAKKIQHHYFFPQEIEFAIEKRKIYILQAQPMT